jgi:membrane protein YqaA with SNARE-associated domain
VLTWLGVTLGVAMVSSVFPPVSAELFVLGFAARHPHLPVLAFGTVLAVGQVAGKLLYFYAARGSIRLPRFVQRKPKRDAQVVVARPRGVRRWWAGVRQAWVWLRDRCHRHPRWMIAATACSALIGLPPFLAMSILAGLAGLSLPAFVAASLPARIIRFTVLAATPGVLMHWHWIHHFIHHVH